jgi:isopenicillin N synthase-like dioxygenase
MAGKWMELLTNQGVLACIHRVVCQTSQAARLSAPFFLRPKEVVFQSLSDEFNSPLQVSETMSPKDATTAIHSMFQGFIGVTKQALHP